MQNYQVIRAKKYLFRFDEILKQMSNKMLSQEVTNSITINFIKCMIPHHEATFFMSENLVQYTKHKPLEEIAKNIIKVQTDGIEQMRKIEKTTYGFINNKIEVNNYMTRYLEITKNMIEKMKNAPRCLNINLNFVNEMIPHHEGAIFMCENLLQYRIDQRLKRVANSIIEEQTEGIKQLKQIQKS